MIKKNKNQILREAADQFTKKASILSSVLEIAIVGSVAGGDPYPNDLDISLVLDNLDELVQISKYARQMSRYRKYPVLEDTKVKCIICGRTFLFTSSEQKWYKDQGYNQPKRCSDCRENKYINNF